MPDLPDFALMMVWKAPGPRLHPDSDGLWWPTAAGLLHHAPLRHRKSTSGRGLREVPEGKGRSSTQAARRPALGLCLESGLLKKGDRRLKVVLGALTYSEWKLSSQLLTNALVTAQPSHRTQILIYKRFLSSVRIQQSDDAFLLP